MGIMYGDAFGTSHTFVDGCHRWSYHHHHHNQFDTTTTTIKQALEGWITVRIGT
jgi:hypothetical protein